MRERLKLPLRKFFRNYATAVEKYTVVMLRHGESEYNKSNLFTGWFDSKLSSKGKEEAKSAGQTLHKDGHKFHEAFTSLLTRAKETLSIILREIQQQELPTRSSWRLNERHYGDLTGLNKTEASVKFGSKQVLNWRRGFSVVPPPMSPQNKHYDGIRQDPRYAGQDIGDFPMCESLEMTAERTLPYWRDVITPEIKAGKKVLIVAHGNSLRGLVKHLDQISDKDIVSLNIPTGIPFVYKLDENFMPVPKGSMLYLGDPALIKKAVEALMPHPTPRTHPKS